MRKNYFVGGLVQAAITLGTKALGKKTTSSKSTSFVDPRMARAELLQTLDESAQQSIASLKEGQEMRNRQNPVENLELILFLALLRVIVLREPLTNGLGKNHLSL